MKRSSILLVGLLLGTAPLDAQVRWRLGAEFGATTFSSAVHDTATSTSHLRPWHPNSLTLRLVREGGSIGFGLGATLIAGQVATSIEEFVLIPGDEVSIAEIAPEIRWRFASTSTGATATLSGGPVWDLFATSGYDPVSRFGGQAGVTLSLPLGSALNVDLRGDLTATGSQYPNDVENGEIELDDVMWRGRFGVGLSARL